MHKRLIVIAGPTGVGKTDVAIQLARALQKSIISADSRQCYRELNIGVARPTPTQLAAAPHYFIASESIHQPVSAAGFERMALSWLEELFETTDIVVLCGGTGLYIRALCDGLDDIPTPDPQLSAALHKEYNQKGLSWLQDTLAKEDPLFLSSGVDVHNSTRLLRALAVLRSTGKSILSYQSGTAKQRPFETSYYHIELPRELLYQRINARVDHMMAGGLLDEVRSLLCYRHLPVLRTVGYAELFHFLEGTLSLEAAVDKIKQHTRNYAKRQLTWFRNDGRFVALPAASAAEDILELL